MNCIREEVIQQYIDGEVSEKESAAIEQHLETCKKCTTQVIRQRHLSDLLIKAMNPAGDDNTEIPDFIIPEGMPRKLHYQDKRVFYYTAAACILLFFLFIFPGENMLPVKDNTLVIDVSIPVDANKPITQLPVTLQIIDSKSINSVIDTK